MLFCIFKINNYTAHDRHDNSQKNISKNVYNFVLNFQQTVNKKNCIKKMNYFPCEIGEGWESKRVWNELINVFICYCIVY